MKNLIEYYYNIKIDELCLEKDKYFFENKGNYFYFVLFNRTKEELNDILECIRQLKFKNIPVHEIIINNKNEYVTLIDDVLYVLMKVTNKNQEYNLFEMIDYNKKLVLKKTNNKLYRNNWANLWSTKIDYIEQQLNDLQINKTIHNSIDYYIGLAENAIYYINIIQNKYPISSLDKIVLSRKRTVYPNYGLNYFNPLTFIFDLEIRDIAEYIKSIFFANGDAFLELQTYLKSVKLGFYSYNMLFVRLLYPSYYFDLYENIINNAEDSELLISIIEKSEEYEFFLKKAYDLINSYAPLEKVDWLIYKH